MSKKSGKIFRIFVVDGETKTAIPLEKTTSLSINNGIVDASDNDSGWEENLDGIRAWSASTEANYDFNDVANPVNTFIDNLLTSGSTETEIIIGLVDDSTLGGNLTHDTTGTYFKGKARIESFELGGDDVVGASISLKGNGKLEKINPS